MNSQGARLRYIPSQNIGLSSISQYLMDTYAYAFPWNPAIVNKPQVQKDNLRILSQH